MRRHSKWVQAIGGAMMVIDGLISGRERPPLLPDPYVWEMKCGPDDDPEDDVSAEATPG